MALIAPLCINWIEAQKTIANSFQKQISGSGPNSVYGGYQSSSSAVQRRQQQQTALVSPVQQSQRTSYSQSSETYRQPAYQQQLVSSSSYESNQQQAEADAEPASYGKSCFDFFSLISFLSSSPK